MAIYSVTVDAVALVAATAKTVLELGTSATARARILQWWCWFDGVSASAIPVKIEVQRASAAVTTATAATEEPHDPAEGAASTAATHSATAEGAGTLSGGEIHKISPTTGLLVQYPMGRELVLPVSAFWRMRLTAAAAVNATVGVIWEE